MPRKLPRKCSLQDFSLLVSRFELGSLLSDIFPGQINMDRGKSGEHGHPAAIPVARASKQGSDLVQFPDLEAGPAMENPQREGLAKLPNVQVGM